METSPFKITYEYTEFGHIRKIYSLNIILPFKYGTFTLYFYRQRHIVTWLYV